MSSMKEMYLLCFTCALLVSICWAQVAKSQPTTSTLSDSKERLEKQSSARSYTSGSPVDPNNYMNQIFQHKPIELFHLVPIILVLAFIPLLLPIIIQLFAGLITPFNFSHGRRKRDTNFHKNPEISQLLLDLAKKFGESFEKFNEISH